MKNTPGDEKQQQLLFSTKVALAKQHYLHCFNSHFVHISDSKDDFHRAFGENTLRKYASNGFKLLLASFKFIDELSGGLFDDERSKIRESATTLYALAVVLFMFVFSGEPPAEKRILWI